MSLKFSSVKLTGNPGPSGWTQIHEFSPENEEKKEKRGTLFAVVSTKLVKEGVDSVVAGRELISRFHEEYFGNLDSSPFVALKTSLEKVIKEFSDQWQESVEIAAAAILDGVVYTAAGGGSSVSILREGGLAKILTSEQKSVVSASGYPKAEDFLILATDSFFKAFGEGTLKASLEGPNLESFVESLAPGTHAKEDEGSIGVVVIKFNPEVYGETPVFMESNMGVTNNVPKQLNNETIGNIKTKSGILFNKFNTRIKNIGIKFPDRKIYVREGFKEDVVDGGKKTTFTVGFLLLILLLISIGFGIKQRNTTRLKSQYEPKLIQAQQEFDESFSLVNLDKQRSRELFLSSQIKVKELLDEEISDKRLMALDEKIKEAEGSLLGIYKIEPEMYMDLSLISSGFKGDSLVFSGNNLYIFDKDGLKVSRVKTDTKKTEIVAGPEQLKDVYNVTAYEDEIYGLSSDGIYLLTKKKEKIIDKDWGEDVSLFAYAGNMYLLNKAESTITRFPAIEGGFAKGQDWLAPGIDINFSGVVSTAVDGSIWFLFEPFKVLKLSQGSPQSFKTDEVPGGLEKADIIYSNETTSEVYLLDKNNKRITAFLKDGGYKAQYSTEILGEAVDFVVSEEEKMIIVLTGDKLYSIELKHL